MDYKIQVYILFAHYDSLARKVGEQRASTRQELGVLLCSTNLPDCLLPLLKGQGEAVFHGLC